ncbi:MAG: M20/M25/M40 family metallo-hydrolase, partial [bacterium]
MSHRSSTIHFFARALVVATAVLMHATPVVAQERVDVGTIQRIKAEEASRSHVMELMSWLSDVFGPRLTWSPNAARAADWAMGQMKTWGLANVHEETWDTPAGLGWQNDRFSLNASTPVPFIVQAVPQAWSAGTDGAVTGPAVLVHSGCSDEMRTQYAGRLRGAFVMVTPPLNKPVALFTAPATRLTDSALAVMAAAKPVVSGRRVPTARAPVAAAPVPRRSAVCEAQAQRDSMTMAAIAAARGVPMRPVPRGVSVGDTATLRWLSAEGVSAILLADERHAGGDVGTNNGASRLAGVARVPTVHVAQESYGRIARILNKNVPVTLTLDMQNTFLPQNTSSANIIGEIPGTDPKLKDEVVMIGAHFDSWHSGTGATDNGAGSGVMLEAMRLIKTLGLSPRRTIRIALWTGEEQGLLGSTAYVRHHFVTRDAGGVHATDEQAKLAAYFNLDNGSGRIRGVYLQGIAEERPIFEAWMAPFRKLGMRTATISNTGGTDHLSFISVGLPGFQFIQDPLDYGTATHHTNQDVYERLQPDDMKFNSAVVASFAWQAA